MAAQHKTYMWSIGRIANPLYQGFGPDSCCTGQSRTAGNNGKIMGIYHIPPLGSDIVILFFLQLPQFYEVGERIILGGTDYKFSVFSL